ncbi:hypothetical protein Tco_0580733 [Tanacetum coccineum]
MKSESSARDSSFESSAGPSRKRCRSLAAILRLLLSMLRGLDIEADATAVNVAVDRDVKARVDAGIDMEVDVRIGVEDEVESIDKGTMVGVDLATGLDILDAMLMLDVVERLEQVEFGIGCLIMVEKRASLLERFHPERINEALAIYEATRAANALEAESQSQNAIVGENRNWLEMGNGRMKWCNGNRTIGAEAAFAMSWRDLMKLMTGVYCPRNNIQKMESELLQDAIRNANNLMDKSLKGYAVKNVRAKKIKKVQSTEAIIQKAKCWRQGHYRSDCPKLKDQNCGNKAGNKNGVGEARGKAYVLGGGEANPDSNVIKGLLGHPFNIDLMPVELGSFDVIIGMD